MDTLGDISTDSVLQSQLAFHEHLGRCHGRPDMPHC